MSVTVRRDHRWLFGVFVLLACVLPTAATSAAFKGDSDYNLLLAELGAATPNGDGVRVTQVEASTDGMVDEDGVPLDGEYNFAPDPSNEEFNSPAKNFTVRIPPPTLAAGYSSHATGAVGRQFYGNTVSIANGIMDIESFYAEHWLGDGQVGTLSGAEPLANAHLSRISNHSYIGADSDPAIELEIMQRVDWLVDRDDFITVVGRDDQSGHLLHSTFNTISVGQVNGLNTNTFSVNRGSIYTGGRPSAEIVSSAGSASSCTPQIASLAAILVEYAHKNPSLSHGSNTDRNAQTIYYGETSEAIKAMIMAGGNRDFVTSFSNGDIYTVDTANGLDSRYGAGMANVYHSYHMLAAGEQDSAADGGGSIAAYGFDYDNSFGGLSGSNALASYTFTTIDQISEMAVSLVWNAKIDMAEVIAGNLGTAAVLHNLDLTLIRQTVMGDVIVATSNSTVENTENIWLQDLSAGVYRLQVSAVGASFDTDYALAWRFNTTSIPTPNAALATGLLMMLVATRRRRSIEARSRESIRR